MPALWGLREFDAFLLVVDGIPWGGAFTPALATLDIANVERIEVLKGAAPVSYGATSFVGVIHVIHYAAGQGPRASKSASAGRGSARIAATMPLSDANAAWRQSLLFDADTVELSGDRTGWDRAHLLYRGAGSGRRRRIHGRCRRQFPQSGSDEPASARRPPAVAARSDRCKRQSARREAGRGSRAARARLRRADERGRLEHAARVCAQRRRQRQGIPASGFRGWRDAQRRRVQQDVHRTEVYFDSHIATPITDRATLVWGLDYLYGKGDQESQNFEYAVLPNGSNAPDWRSLHIDETTRLDDKRNFLGVYADLEFAITDAWRLELGVRFNHTNEKTNGLETDLTGEAPVVTDGGSDEHTDNRWAGAFGTSYRFWEDGRDYVTGYANYRDTFKPAVVDFGPEAEFDILKPEDAKSGELGVRGRHLDGHFEWDLSVFRMDFRNLVVSQDVDGLPVSPMRARRSSRARKRSCAGTSRTR